MISELVAKQRAYYATGATRSCEFRKEALAKLARGLDAHQEALYQALQADLNKPPCESHLCEVGMVRSELRYHQKHLRKWTKRCWRSGWTTSSSPAACPWARWSWRRPPST